MGLVVICANSPALGVRSPSNAIWGAQADLGYGLFPLPILAERADRPIGVAVHDQTLPAGDF